MTCRLFLPVTALLLAGCGVSTTPSESAGPGTPASTSVPGVSPTAAGGTPTTIPDDVLLPHEGAAGWSQAALERSPLTTTCGRPPATLTGVRATDLRSITADTTAGRFENLGVYASARDADEDVDEWRRRIERCDGTTSSEAPDGTPIVWSVLPIDVEGADQAWFAHGEPAVEVPKDDPYVVVVRVGNAVYAQGLDHAGRLPDAVLRSTIATNRSEVADVVETLSDFAGAESVPAAPTRGRDATIPDDVRLVRDGEWLERSRGTSPFVAPCYRAPARLAIADAADDITLTAADGYTHTESLALYPTPADAREALERWRAQEATCAGPGSTSESGIRFEVRVEAGDVAGADEVWFAYDVLGEELPSRFETVVRVGNVVHTMTGETPGTLSDTDLDRLRAAGAAEVTDYLPTLARLAG